jgi:hypothetical protein
LGKEILINLKLNTAMDRFELELFVMYLLIVIVVWVLVRPIVWWYYGTKETHRLLSEILAELK